MEPAEPARIQFEEESVERSGSFARAGSSGLVYWLVAHSGGLVSDKKRGQYVLVVLVVAIAATLFLLRRSGTYVERGGPGPSAEELTAYRAIQPS